MLEKMADIEWEEILDAVVLKDEMAFKKIFFHFYDNLLHFSLSITKNVEVSEDIVSELMSKIWTNADKFQQVSNLKTYLFQSVKNSSLNHLSQQKIRTLYKESESPVQPPYTPEQLMLSKEFGKQLEEIIDKMPPKMKMAFTLIKDNSLSYKEAAVIMEVSTNTVDRHIQMALAHIRGLLKKINNS
ncbi:RNA polymerase sigma factor [Sphingobacterium suaedae]|uniref:RNA polymerase sigma factor n=1 Tax=Sphingobacterium suaedae TaxID=1686402 RepID=A0ABW5KLC8_9SPHI